MDLFIRILSEWNIDISKEQLKLFERYYDLLIEWNSRINLTTITEKEDVYVKHFADSIALCRYYDLSNRSLIDIGTGAGFPGVPIKIMNPHCHVVLADSLGKRITFLNELISELELSDITAVHGRAEDLAGDVSFREQFDIATSRAVANLSTLSEYCLPFVNINGTFVSYKSGIVDDELSLATNAIRVLGGDTPAVERYSIPFTEYDRSLCFINKRDHTADKYPRRSGIPLKKPL